MTHTITESCQSRSRRTYQRNTPDVTKAAIVPVTKTASTDGAPGTITDVSARTAQRTDRTTPAIAMWITSASVADRRKGVGG